MNLKNETKIKIEFACDAPQEIGELFSEYTDMLIQNAPDFRQYLELQNYENELRHLETKYGPPDGRLYIARCCGVAAGCIGLRKIDEERCEMKRLYVRPAFRGRKIAVSLVQKIISDALEIGYRQMLLDTFPFLKAAIKIYRDFGFYEIPSYNDNPMDNLIYMRLDL